MHHTETVNGYKTSVIHNDPNVDAKRSVSTVTVHHHMTDNKQAQNDDVYRQPQAEQQVRSHHSKHSYKNTHSMRENSLHADAESGASNSDSALRYALPPDGFISQQKHNQQQLHQNQNNNYNHNGYGTTPAPSSDQSAPSAPQSRNNNHNNNNNINNNNHNNDNQDKNNNNNQYQQYSSASNMHFVSTPAPSHFLSTASSRNQYPSNSNNYQQSAASHVQYVSAPGPLSQYSSNSPQESHYIQSAQSNNNVHYVQSAPSRIQYASTPAPVVHVGSNEPPHSSGAQLQFMSTISPNVQYVSTPAPHDHYVSTPAHYASTPSSIQFATSLPNFGARLLHGQSGAEKQMNIDHFDNAMSGVRNPKYSPQNNFGTSTVSPVVISTTTITPILHKSNDDQWGLNQKNNIFSSENFHREQQSAFASNQYPQNVHYQQLSQNPSNFQDQQLHLNAAEAANNLVINVVHPNAQSRVQKSQNNKNYQRDLEKDTEASPSYTNGEYGWKISPKKQSSNNNVNDNTPQNSVLYPISSHTINTGIQSLAQQPSQSYEYRPYPENPFLNHISFPSASPPLKTGSIQSVNIHSDNSEEQNINVGYSIGFGNNGQNQEMLKTDQTVYANRYPFGSHGQSFTTAFPRHIQSDVVKGVHVSQVEIPDQSFYLKNSNNPQDFVANALKINEKIKNVNSAQYGNGGEQSYSYNVPSSPYKISHTVKTVDAGNAFHSPKSINFHNNNGPSVITTYHGTSDKNNGYKWTNLGSGVEVSGSNNANTPKPLLMEYQIPSSTPSPLVFVNNHNNDVVTNTPFFFTTQKDNSERLVQSFDHANALKNIQPIGISNVVPHSPTPAPDTSSGVTTAPHYIGQNLQFSPHLTQMPSGQIIQHFPDQSQPISSANSVIDQGLANIFNNYNPLDHTIFKGKNVIYNVQPMKQKTDAFDGNSNFGDFRTSFLYGKPREQFSFESAFNQHSLRPDGLSSGSFIITQPADMIGHSSNVETRQTPGMVYVPSETFRNSNSRESQNDQSSSARLNQIYSENKESPKYHVVNHNSKNIYGNDAYEVRINQNLGSHHLEPLSSSSEDNFRIVNNNQRQSNEDVVYENQNEIDPSTGGKLTTIRGIRVANPYNIDLKIVSDMLKGKASIDESRLEPLREQLSRMTPMKLDTLALQEQMMKMDMPDHDIPENIKNRQYINYDPLGPSPPVKYGERNSKNFNIEYSDSPRPFQNTFDQKYQHTVPMIASEQLQNSVQSVLNSHQIGAVIDQQLGIKSRSRNQDDIIAAEDYSNDELEIDENPYAREERVGLAAVQHPNSLASEDAKNKHPKPDVEEPYPLLKPPRPPASSQRSTRKQKRPYRSRFQRTLRHKHNKSSKSQDAEEVDYDTGYGIQTELRPPPVDNETKTG